MGKGAYFIKMKRRGYFSKFPIGFWLFSLAPAVALLDLDGDGVSDLTDLLHPQIEIIFGNSDSDGDGVSDRDEAISGTNPLDASDLLKITEISYSNQTTTLNWNRVVGKSYALEHWDQGSASWVTMPFTLPVAGPVSFFSEADQVIYRVRVFDVDGDGDGLTAWEEALLGWDDDDPVSQSEEEFSDFVSAVRLLEAEGGFTLNDGSILPQRLPSSEEASRFLVQATFGPNEVSILDVQTKGLARWLDDQRGLPEVLTRTTMFQTGRPADAFLWKYGWLKSAFTAPDQLRQRVAYALSQILVVNTDNGTVIGDNPITQAVFYDHFVRGAFGNYRSVLEDVTYSPVMGFYLSHLQNRPANPAINRFPDENFAREIMQLFTIGLWELNPDGSRKLDANDNFIPTYGNEEIKEMARVFTGMSFSRDRNGQIAESFFSAPRGNDYQHPMKLWDDEHDMGEKILVSGQVLPAGQSGEEDVQATLDALCWHENTAPFICRRLIQRFTSSNPSPGYLSRVARVWTATGGSLDSVIEGILLDEEVRTPSVKTSPKVREPIIRMTHLIRALEGHTSGNLSANFRMMNDNFGQYPMLSPTVFNYYLPDHMPSGELREAGLTSPELQIATASNLIGTDNYLRDLITFGVNGVRLNLADGIEVADDSEALLGLLDELLTGENLSETTRAASESAISQESSALGKVRTAVHLIVNSPDFIILK